MSMALDLALRYAEKIASAVRPYCLRLEVAGSIRRRRPIVGDIDLVAIPRDLAGLKARCRESCSVVADGTRNFRARTQQGIEVDFYLAYAQGDDLFNPTPSNWGSLLLCRTGSKEHNICVASAAVKMGRHWNPYVGVFDQENRLIASETEEAVFKAVGLPFIRPEDRER